MSVSEFGCYPVMRNGNTPEYSNMAHGYDNRPRPRSARAPWANSPPSSSVCLAIASDRLHQRTCSACGLDILTHAIADITLDIRSLPLATHTAAVVATG